MFLFKISLFSNANVASLLVEWFSTNLRRISIFFFLSLSHERIKSLTENFVEFRGRDGKLLGAHCICPMQIRLKTSLSCGFVSNILFQLVRFVVPSVRQRDATETITAYK